MHSYVYHAGFFCIRGQGAGLWISESGFAPLLFVLSFLLLRDLPGRSFVVQLWSNKVMEFWSIVFRTVDQKPWTILSCNISPSPMPLFLHSAICIPKSAIAGCPASLKYVSIESMRSLQD